MKARWPIWTLVLALGIGLVRAQTQDPTPSGHSTKKKGGSRPKKPKNTWKRHRERSPGSKDSSDPKIDTEITEKAVTIDLRGK